MTLDTDATCAKNCDRWTVGSCSVGNQLLSKLRH